jgi:hypothetical protein
MAKYVAHLYKEGYESKGNTTRVVGVITAIECEEGDEILKIPDRADEFDIPITHLGYKYEFEPAHEEWADWHHPSKGCDYVPDKHTLRNVCLDLPATVKKVIIPKTIESISFYAWKNREDLTFEVHPDNPKYTAKNGKIIRKEN